VLIDSPSRWDAVEFEDSEDELEEEEDEPCPESFFFLGGV
jgi:hypothetical protein